MIGNEEENCRLCLSKLEENNYLSIFNLNSKNDNERVEISLSNKIMVCLSLPVHYTDALSKKICISCKDDIMHFYEFRQKCQTAHYMMNLAYHENVITSSNTFTVKIASPITEHENKISKTHQPYIINTHANLMNNENDCIIKSVDNKRCSTAGQRELFKPDDNDKRTYYKCYHCSKLFSDLNTATVHCFKCSEGRSSTITSDSASQDKYQDDKCFGHQINHDNMISDDLDDSKDPAAQIERTYEENVDGDHKNVANTVAKYDEQNIMLPTSTDEITKSTLTDGDDDQNMSIINIDEMPTNIVSVDTNPKPNENDHQRPKCRRKKNQTIYPCSQCKKPFSSPGLLKRHFMVHTGERPYQCETCGRRFSQIGALNFHRKLHVNPPYRCKVCSKPFMRPSDIVKHMRIHTGEKPYSCNVCDKKFSQLIAVQQHERIHTGVKPYICEICGKAFSQSANKHKHVKIHKQGTKPHVCDTCGRSFFQIEEMELHRAGHGGGKPRECNYCGERFRRLSEIADHVRRFHTFERPHTCAFCSKSFYSVYSLKQHIMVHTGQKPFACDKCDRKFTQKGNLAKHIIKKHPNSWKVCNVNNSLNTINLNDHNKYKEDVCRKIGNTGQVIEEITEEICDINNEKKS